MKMKTTLRALVAPQHSVEGRQRATHGPETEWSYRSDTGPCVACHDFLWRYRGRWG